MVNGNHSSVVGSFENPCTWAGLLLMGLLNTEIYMVSTLYFVYHAQCYISYTVTCPQSSISKGYVHTVMGGRVGINADNCFQRPENINND